MRKPLLLVALVNLIWLTGCGKKAEERPKHTPQEIAFIRECLAVGLRPTIIIESEGKAVAEAKGPFKPSGPAKTQLADMQSTFDTAATKLRQLASSPPAGNLAKMAQVLAEERARQAANCSRLTDDLLHQEGFSLMLFEFFKISIQASNQQEADRKAGEYLKQNWRSLTNLPVQQKAAFMEILETEQQLQQLVVELGKDAELKRVQAEAINNVLRELESRAHKTADALTPERFYATLIGHQFRTNAGKLEAGEMVKLVITEQKIIGHCIISTIHLDLRGNRSGQTASLNLSIVHKTYADGRPVRILVVLK